MRRGSGLRLGPLTFCRCVPGDSFLDGLPRRFPLRKRPLEVTRHRHGGHRPRQAQTHAKAECDWARQISVEVVVVVVVLLLLVQAGGRTSTTTLTVTYA